jgi:NTE family protein
MARKSSSSSASPARSPTRSRQRGPVLLDLALQGGGSHGAFTWGVLDRLLQEPSIELCGLSGTSAGALNAAVLATGWAEAGPASCREGAQEALRRFWQDVATQPSCFGAWPGAMPMPGLPGLGAFNLDNNPFYLWSQAFLRGFSPYQFNPGGANPLRELLTRHVKPAVLRQGPLDVFVTATAVKTGQARVFDRQDISIDALLASACLPQLFKAVDIEGQPYWDGGYSGNPALWPLIYQTQALDVMLVKINPLVRHGTPDTPAEIADRVNEITFNAGLVAEMRAIAFVQKLLQEKRVEAGAYKNLRLHMVADDEGLEPLQASSKLNTDARFLQQLHDLGFAAAQKWLAKHRAALGQRATLNPRDAFLSGRF